MGDPAIDVLRLGNWGLPWWDPRMKQTIENQCGEGYNARMGHSGALMFRSSAWLSARDFMLQGENRLVWDIVEPATDTCTAAMLHMSCKVEVGHYDSMNLNRGSENSFSPVALNLLSVPNQNSSRTSPSTGFLPPKPERNQPSHLNVYTEWPYGIDMSACLSCLNSCQREFCPNDPTTEGTSDVINCIVQKQCDCPANMHEMHGGLCSVTDEDHESFRGFAEREAQIMTLEPKKPLMCLIAGLCSPSSNQIFRKTSVIFHLSLLIMLSVVIVRHALRNFGVFGYTILSPGKEIHMVNANGL